MTSVVSPATRLLGCATTDLGAHVRRLGPLPRASAESLRQRATESGLTGRGGAGFPAGVKMAAVAAGRRAVVVANGAEGEPASGKDRWLLSSAPHLVLDGLQVAATACEAETAYLYAPLDLLRDVIQPALRQRRDRVAVRIVVAPDAFLSGEESAVVAAVHGRRPVPSSKPPRVFERGVNGRPTLVQNVETLAHLALVARYGAGWFREVGTPAEPGTRLMTLSGAVRRPGVYEVAGGTTLEDILAAAGGQREPVSALLVGGYHGGWVPFTAIGGLPLTSAALAAYDAAPGAGVVIALSSATCGLRAGAQIAGYLAGQGARQCGPCSNGLPTIAASLSALANGSTAPELPAEIARLARLVEGRGACHHPAGTVRLVRSTLRTFSAEVDLHLAGRCSGVSGKVGASR